MARQRTIKPAFFEDEKLGEISPVARLLFIGMWVFADDWGVIKGHPVWLRNNILPYDEIPVGDINQHLDDLARIGVIAPFEHHGQKFLYIRNFGKHQSVKYPSESLRNPQPPAEILGNHNPKSTKKNDQKGASPPVLPQDSPSSGGAFPQPSGRSPQRENSTEQRETERGDIERQEERSEEGAELSSKNTYSDLFFELQRHDKAKSEKAKTRCQQAAYELVEQFHPTYIHRHLEYFRWIMKYRPELAGEKPTGFLIKSITEDYAPPSGYDDWLDDQKKKRNRNRPP